MLKRIFPFLAWFKNYSSVELKADLVSGLTVAMVLIPQSMAYAQLAGLPPYYGLYASFLPPIIASLFGSSRQLATGPVAVVSLMTSAALAPLATSGSEAYILYAVLLALLVGLFQFSLGLFKLGMVVNLLSHPVINGFTNAAAIIIATSQLSKIFGVYVDKGKHHYETVYAVIESALEYTHLPTLGMALLAITIMVGLRKFYPKIPNVLVAVVVTTLISFIFEYHNNSVASLSQFQSENVRETVEAYNVTLASRSRKQDSLISFRQRASKYPPINHIQEVKFQNRLQLFQAEIQAIDKRQRELKKQLRKYQFKQNPDDDHPLYVLKENFSSPKSSSSAIWRINVGSSPLDSAHLILSAGGAIVGKIPSKLPRLKAPHFDFDAIMHLLSVAIVISILGFMEAISIAKAMAAKTGQRLDPNQELIGQGLSNIVGSFFSSYAVSGSFSRSAVNLQAGAETGLSSVFSSVVVGVTILFLTPLLYYLPQSVLAAVIMMAVAGLVNVSGFMHALRVQWYDGVISIISFICTLIFAPHLDKGILVGVGLSLGVFLYKSMRPRLVSLSRHESATFKNSFVHDLTECKYIDLIRFDAPLFFANSSYLEDKIDERIKSKQELRHIILACNGISDIDASGEETLLLLIERLRSSNIDISFSAVNEYVLRVFKRTHLYEMIRPDHIYPTMEHAVSAIQARAHRDGDEKNCSFMKVGNLFYYDDCKSEENSQKAEKKYQGEEIK